MISTIIIEQKKEARAELSSMISMHHPEISIISVFSSLPEALPSIGKSEPRLLMLDEEAVVELERLNHIAYNDYEMIYMCGSDACAERIDDTQFAGILSKPFKIEELEKLFSNLKTFFKLQRHINRKLNELIPKSADLSMTGPPKIILKSNRKLVVVPVNDIIRCEADKNYTYFYLNDGRKITIAKSLSGYAELLEKFNFVRTHKSHLVNLRYVRLFENFNSMRLSLEDGSAIPVSFRRKEFVLNALKKVFIYY